jgi:hypothetical protein
VPEHWRAPAVGQSLVQLAYVKVFGLPVISGLLPVWLLMA